MSELLVLIPLKNGYLFLSMSDGRRRVRFEAVGAKNIHVQTRVFVLRVLHRLSVIADELKSFKNHLIYSKVKVIAYST